MMLSWIGAEAPQKQVECKGESGTLSQCTHYVREDVVYIPPHPTPLSVQLEPQTSRTISHRHARTDESAGASLTRPENISNGIGHVHVQLMTFEESRPWDHVGPNRKHQGHLCSSPLAFGYALQPHQTQKFSFLTTTDASSFASNH